MNNKKLQVSENEQIFPIQLDVWLEARSVGEEAHIMVPPGLLGDVETFLSSKGMTVTTAIPNVERYI